MSGPCFKCTASVATRPIYATGAREPDGFVCKLCDLAAVQLHRQQALEFVERAQREMGIASEKLSAISYGDPARLKLRTLYEKIHAAWYRLKDTNHSKWSMDDNYWVYRFREAQKS